MASAAAHRFAAFSSALLLGACAAQNAVVGADSPGDTRWVQGSLVNVREAPTARATVVAQLTINTAVTLRQAGETYCDIGWEAGRHGYIACKLLGPRPLRLDEVAPATLADGRPNPQYSPLRAFWIEPGVGSFQDAGHYLQATLLSQAQRQAEDPELRQAAAQAGTTPADTPAIDPAQPPQRPVVGEFEAMKRRLAEGVAAPARQWQPPVPWNQVLATVAAANLKNPDVHIDTPQYSPVENLVMYPQIPLPAAHPSWFKSLADIGRPSADAAQLSAQFPPLRYAVRVAGPAHWVTPQYSDRYVYGAWDAGALELRLLTPMTELVLDAQGQVRAQATSAESHIDADDSDDAECGSARMEHWTLTRGAPADVGPTEAAWPLALLRTLAPPPPGQARVSKREVSLAPWPKHLPPPDNQGPFQRGTLTSIDLDGDGTPDLALWDAYRPSLDGSQEGQPPLLLLRLIFVNVGGSWYALDSDGWEECAS